jgi:hypothetical protein
VDFYCDSTVVGTKTVAPFSVSWNSALAGNGSHGFSAKAYDAGGNWMQSASSTVTVSNGTTGTPGQLVWTKGVVGSTFVDSAAVNGTACDSNGNVLVAGSFWGSANFGGTTFHSLGICDVGIAKYSAAGAHLWSQSFGGPDYDYAMGVAVDANNNVIVVGYFAMTANFGTGPLTSAGGYDIFLAKYSPSGTPLWSKRFGTTANDSVYGVGVDSGGNIFLTGCAPGAVDFGNGPVAGLGAAFLAKFSPAGTALWSKHIGGIIGRALAVDSTGNVVVTGGFSGTTDFGGGTVSSTGGSDIFLAKYSPQGTYVWSKKFGGTGADAGYGVATAGNGDVVMTGQIQGTVDLGGGGVAVSGNGGVVLARYSSNGSYLWSRGIGASWDVTGPIAAAVSVDGSGNVLMTGGAMAAEDFGGGFVTGTGSWNPFIAKYTASGQYVWAKRLLTAGDSYSYAVTPDVAGNSLFGGSFSGQINCDGSTLSTTATSAGFLLKFAP